MPNKSNEISVSPEAWLEFSNTDLYCVIMSDMEQLKQGNLDAAMKLPDKAVMPNENAIAYLCRAQGIQTVIDNFTSRTELAKANAKKSKGEKSE